MATWIVKIDGFVPAKYIGTKTVKGKEVVLVSWSKFSQHSYYDVKKYERSIKEINIDRCTILRKPGPKEMKFRMWLMKQWMRITFRSWVTFLEWQYEYKQKFE